MKVLLVCKSKIMENLGVMYLSSVIKECGSECRIVDMDEAMKVATSWIPEVIGYSVMTGDQNKFKRLNGYIKGALPNVTSVVGGPHPTFFPDDCFWADAVIPGEAEQKIAELLNSPRRYSQINDLPWPDRSDFKNYKIRDFISSRGCPFNCSYCFNEQWAKLFPDTERVRTRAVEDVINEISFVDAEFVYFQDSCFGVSLKWLREFSREYRERINIPYHCHLRPSQVTEERAELLATSGCVSVRIALESASPRLRKLLNRGSMKLEDVSGAVKLLRKHNVNLMIQNMIGIPTSKIEDDLETLEFNLMSNPAYGWVSIYSPYPGTDLGEFCKKSGLYKGNYGEISDNFFDTTYLEVSPAYKEQLECLQKVFALCVEVGYLPDKDELTHKNFPKLVHKIMRKLGDSRLYGGVI